MRILGKVKNFNSKLRLIELPALAALTNCSYKENPAEVAAELLQAIVYARLKSKIKVSAKDISDDEFYLECHDIKKIMAIVIAQIREKNNLSQRELAKKIGRKSHSCIKVYELAKSEPSLTIFLEILAAMNVSMSIKFE